MIAALLFAVTVATKAPLTPLEGEYYQGDGLGVNWTLRLNGKHEFSFTWSGCMGIYGEASGTWSVENESLRLNPTAVHDMGEKLPQSYEIIRWGARIYLVPRDEMPRFCMYVNQGWEARQEIHGLFFLKAETADIPVTGKPALSGQYREFLLPSPVRAYIVSFEGHRGTINAGIVDHLRVGMLLSQHIGDDSNDVRIVSVADHSAVIESMDDTPLQGGAAVSSLIYDQTLQP
jgi:hypothetical protein